MRSFFAVLTATAGLFGALSFTPAAAMPIQRDVGAASDIMLTAQGCGPGRWRGPWGHCRSTPYRGPLPGGGYRYGNGCGPRSWRGPWGHCRHTPYHGPLPGGGYK
ncbi:MAG: hypothetical protein WDN46_05425 [Methylocella sp.]